MSFLQAVKSAFVNCINFKGRTGRKEFWSFILFFIIAQTAIGISKYSIMGASLKPDFYLQVYENSSFSIGDIFTLICNLVLIFPLCSLIVRRLRDAGKLGLRIILLYPLFIPFCWHIKVFLCFGPVGWFIVIWPVSFWLLFFTGIFGPFYLLVPLLKASKEEDFEEDIVPQLQTEPKEIIEVPEVIEKKNASRLQTDEPKEAVELTDEEKKKKAVRTTILFLFIDAAILIVIFMIAFRPDSNWSKHSQKTMNIDDSMASDALPGHWSKRSQETMNWNDAKQYCENLRENGYTDWRLPTIDELKTTIKNCPAASLCKVSESCLSSDCWSASCHCKYRENNGGYYSKLGDDDKVKLWSSSTRSDLKATQWGVGFGDGYVQSIYAYESDHNYVRCVR